MKSFGLIQIYTGPGKGKTTAAIGQAVRACGHGAKAIMIQFMKGRQYGELKCLQKVDNFDILQFGRDEFVDKRKPAQIDIEYARRGLEKARELIKERRYDLLILDEVNVAVDYGLIPIEDVLELLREKPEKMEMILTGRHAAQELREAAHLVTEMREVKHPYQQGIEMRKGIDY
ncbi:MAG: cob(I)yrinic acid a,c-diamide adenosyltransferase [bacterium]